MSLETSFCCLRSVDDRAIFQDGQVVSYLFALCQQADGEGSVAAAVMAMPVLDKKW